MSNSIVNSMIIPNIDHFLVLYEKVELVLGVSDLQVDLVADSADCVMRVGDFASSTLVSRLVHSTPTVKCALPAYLEKHGIPQTLGDLEKHLRIVYFHGRNRKVKEGQFTVNDKTQPIRIKPALMTNDHETYVDCSVKGLVLAQIGRAYRKNCQHGISYRCSPIWTPVRCP